MSKNWRLRVPDGSDKKYEPPTIERLGTLTELTQGGTTGVSDGISGGASGATGSL
ncbi:MAG: lasso RiPP family leader peptide-containing protein [Acidimicrobiales bacterium]